MQASEFWKWDFLFEAFPILAKASLITLYVTLISFIIALALGLIFAVLRGSKQKWLSFIVGGIIEFIRSTPILIQLFIIYYVLPEFEIVIDSLFAGILALGIHYATYCSEIFRSGIDNVPQGQWEACQALNLPSKTSFFEIIIPQAIPPIVPNLGNYWIALFKDTPILSSIAIVEMMQSAKIIGSTYFRYIEPITTVGFFFLIFSLIAALIVNFIEKLLKKKLLHE